VLGARAPTGPGVSVRDDVVIVERVFRNLHRPFLGHNVTHLWCSYPWCLFLELGHLTPAKYKLPRDEIGAPCGEFSLTTMQSWPVWELRLHKRLIVTSEDRKRHIRSSLQLLRGRRLLSFEIEEPSHITRLTFSHGITLHTGKTPPSLRREPHWLVQSPGNPWRPVALPGTFRDWHTPVTSELRKFSLAPHQ
jgi:hypothetical protein